MICTPLQVIQISADSCKGARVFLSARASKGNCRGLTWQIC